MPGPESSRRLVAHVDGVVGLTEKGKLAIELVRINHILTQNRNPGINFAISRKEVNAYSLRREELCRLLGIPEEKQGKRITSYRRKLREQGFPYWRIPTS